MMSTCDIIKKLGPDFPWQADDSFVWCSREHMPELYNIIRIANTVDEPLQYLEDLKVARETIKILSMMREYGSARQYALSINMEIYNKYIVEYMKKHQLTANEVNNIFKGHPIKILDYERY